MIGRRRRAQRVRNQAYILAREGNGWTNDEILQAIRLWTQIHGEPPRWIDWSLGLLLKRGQLPKPGVLDGHWPTSRQLESRFKTFNGALRRAGVTPRPAHRPSSSSSAVNHNRKGA